MDFSKRFQAGCDSGKSDLPRRLSLGASAGHNIPTARLGQRRGWQRFVELPEADICCGSAGSYNLTEPEMAARLQKRKIDHIISTGADVVVTSNPGCQLQIQAGLKKAGSNIRTMHIADYLTERGE